MSHRRKFHAFWAINARLEPARSRMQLEAFAHAGCDGVVLHPRFYPGEPPYLSADYLAAISETVLLARELGLSCWLYDENGWPSGTVGGAMLAQHPEVAQQWAGLGRAPPAKEDDVLATFAHAGQRWWLVRRTGAGVDYLHPATAAHFLRLTYERYRDGLVPAAWAHVEAMFCDEPEFGLGHAFDALPADGAIPWTVGMEARYAVRYGRSLGDDLPALFFPGEEAGEARVRFWELLRDEFCAAFLAPLNDWCRAEGKRFTAHIKGEEHPLFQVPMVGSCSAVYRHLSLPGIDALERGPGNEFFPLQLVASARQFGDGRCMAEAFGGAGWGAAPEDLERYLRWLGRAGVTDFVLHLAQYRLDSAAIRDWPPSQPLHLNWAGAYPEVLRRVRAELTARPPREADTLVVTPHRGIMRVYAPRELLATNIHHAATYPDSPAARINRTFLTLVDELHAAGATVDFTDEATFETYGEARAEGGVRVGGCAYARVILAEGAELRGGPAVEFVTSARAIAVGQALPSMLRTTEAAVAGSGVPALPGEPGWALRHPNANTWLLETRAGRADFAVDVAPDEALRAQEWLVIFADDVTHAACNGEALELVPLPDGTAARLPGALLRADNTLEFTTASPVTEPFVWVQGDFRVVSRSAWHDGPGGTLATAGPFVGRATAAADHLDLTLGDTVRDGYPFARGPFVVEAMVELRGGAVALRLEGVVADAARVALAGHDLGWTWGPAWRVELPPGLAAGAHPLRLELVPSTYNFFGPHRYVGGDAHVVSPDQFSGRKNFADPADAPAETRGAVWHFRPVRRPARVQVERASRGLSS